MASICDITAYLVPAFFLLQFMCSSNLFVAVVSEPLSSTSSASALASCTDDKDFRFVVDGKTRKCKWVSNQPDERCNKKQTDGTNKKKLKQLCRAACDNCPEDNNAVPPSCTDDKEFKFVADGKERKCKWVSNQPADRCNKKQTDGRKKKLKQLCRSACDNCKKVVIDDEKRTLPPTTTPSANPTNVPITTSPTLLPTTTTSKNISPNNNNNNAVKVINNTPMIKQGATIYDKIDQASISVFGESCLGGGCLVKGGETLNVGNIAGTQDRTNYLLGIQWNVARMAPDHGLCDNPCRQLRVDLNACKFLSYETTGTCYTNADGIENYSPRWYPDVVMDYDNDTTGTPTCILTVTTASAMEKIHGTEPDTCGCQSGAYPCTCGADQDAACVGQCPGDDDTGSQCNPFGSKPDECCFCEGSNNTCPRTTTVTPATSVPTTSPTSSLIPKEDRTQYPCGCSTCTEDVLNTYAGEYKCRDRINFLRYEQGYTEEDACAKVGGNEYPDNEICGKCDPNRCIDDDEDDDDNNDIDNDIDDNNEDESPRPSPRNSNKCGAAVNSSNDSNQVCHNDVWDPTEDATMHCFAYGGAGDPCHLNNNNDPNDGLDKNPLHCTTGDTFYLWDEPDTQGRSYQWSGQKWYDYSRRFANELQQMRALGTKVTSPLLKAGSDGVLGRNLDEFFDACGPACSDRNDPAYIDIIAINAFCGDFNGAAGCRGGAAFITNEAIQLYIQRSLPVYITNWSRLGTSNPDDQLDAMDAIDEFFLPQKNDNDEGIIERVYWFGATDFGGGSSNNFLTKTISDGVTTLGEYWHDKCNSL